MLQLLDHLFLRERERKETKWNQSGIFPLLHLNNASCFKEKQLGTVPKAR